jgi:hypothetical protein
MNRWRQAAYALCRVRRTGADGQVLPSGWCDDGPHAGADRRLICRCAGWDPAGTTFEVAYFDIALAVDSAAAPNLFGDLRGSGRLVRVAVILGVS